MYLKLTCMYTRVHTHTHTHAQRRTFPPQSFIEQLSYCCTVPMRVSGSPLLSEMATSTRLASVIVISSSVDSILSPQASFSYSTFLLALFPGPRLFWLHELKDRRPGNEATFLHDPATQLNEASKTQLCHWMAYCISWVQCYGCVAQCHVHSCLLISCSTRNTK